MQSTAPADIRILQDTDLPRQSQAASSGYTPDNTMYMYRTQHTLDNIPVQQQAHSLAVSSEAELRQALQCTGTPRVFMQWVGPQGEQLQQYTAILQKVADGQAAILQQTKQYSQARGKYLFFVKYVQYQYRLNPRYQYLAEDGDNI